MAIIARAPEAERGPRLRPDRGRILESILFIIQQGEKIGDCPTQYEIAKSLFVADDEHIQEYGRPVTFDNYAAMKFGPVPSEAYDMLKPGYDWRGKIGLQGPLWETAPAPEFGAKARRFIRPKRPPNLRRLSGSDQRALAHGFELVRRLRFKRTRDLTHEHPAYKAAWKGDEGTSYPMDYRILVGDDPSLAQDIAHASKYV